MKAIRYPSSDGLEIPAYLTLPKGVPAKATSPDRRSPRRTLGPRLAGGSTTYAQFLANRGYAVLQPNFRGSTGYGKKFLNAGNKQWGDRMQDDITWGVKYLVKEGIVDPKRVGIMGGSYGGLRDPRRRHLYAGPLCRGRLHRRPLQPPDAPRDDSALLGGRPDHLPRAHGQPEHPRGQEAARAPVAPQLRHEDQDAAPGGPGRQRSRA